MVKLNDPHGLLNKKLCGYCNERPVAADYTETCEKFVFECERCHATVPYERGVSWDDMCDPCGVANRSEPNRIGHLSTRLPGKSSEWEAALVAMFWEFELALYRETQTRTRAISFFTTFREIFWWLRRMEILDRGEIETAQKTIDDAWEMLFEEDAE